MIRSYRVSSDMRSDAKEKVEAVIVSDPTQGRTVSGLPGRAARQVQSRPSIVTKTFCYAASTVTGPTTKDLLMKGTAMRNGVFSGTAPTRGTVC